MNNCKLFCFYYPQFHQIEQNDRWWGTGFTDWVNVKKAQPLFPNHYQPRIPLNKNYYDLSQKDTIKWQIDLAKQYGIAGFAHYHYWFDGVQLLEKPTEIYLESKELDLPFCLVWANETWSRRWDGKDHHILQLQTHVPEKYAWKKHFNYLFNAWIDDRYITIDNKPIFIIYRPYKIIQIENMLDYWRELAHKRGFSGIYFMTMKQYNNPLFEKYTKYFDGIIKFQPFDAMSSFMAYKNKRSWLAKNTAHHFPSFLRDKINRGHEILKHQLDKKISKPSIWNYDDIWNKIVQDEINKSISSIETYPGAFIDWDNTARYKNRSKVFDGASPGKFSYWLERLVSTTQQNSSNPMIFINAWNEWAEGTYLEPDEKFNFQYLESIKKIVIDQQ